MSADLKSPSSISAETLRVLLADRLLRATARSRSSPLSSSQQRLWFLDQLEPNTPLYNIPSVARLTGTLDVAAFEQALNAIVARHETLRSRFASEDGEPVQIVDQEVRIEIEQHDLMSIPEPEREQAMQQRVREEVKRPFNLGTDRLLRATLLQTRADERILIINMHHIVSDEWSLKIFYHELEQLYTALVLGTEPLLPELPIQYSDYALWQLDWLTSDDFHRQLNFWKEQLQGNPPGVDLPTDRPRPFRPTSGGAVQTRELGQ